MKIGLFFGSFNPIHIGHLIIANTMLEYTDMENVWFVVSPQNPFKKSNSLLHEFERLEMVRLAIGYNQKMKVSEVEFSMPKPNYTIDTLTYLHDKYPEHQFVLIMGEDNLIHFNKWKNYEKILAYYEIYVYPRPNNETSELRMHPKVKMVSSPVIGISATFIRTAVKDGKSIQYLVTEEVETYIKQKKIFQE